MAPATRISGTGYGLLDVSVHLTSSSPTRIGGGGLDAGGYEPLDVVCPCAVLTPSGNGPGGSGRRELPVPLRLASGTDRDGTWVARVAVTSGQAGIWRVRGVGAAHLNEQLRLIPTPTGAVANVRAADWITVSTSVAPRPRAGRTSVVNGVVRLARAHRPVAGLRLNVGLTSDCLEEPGTAVRTDRNGRFRVVLRAGTKLDTLLWQRRLNGRIAEQGC